jgi:hypothetical protein
LVRERETGRERKERERERKRKVSGRPAANRVAANGGVHARLR